MFRFRHDHYIHTDEDWDKLLEAASKMVEGFKQVTNSLLLLNNKTDKIMATQAEHAAELRALKEQNEKAAAEQAAALKKVQDALEAAGNTSPEVDAAMAELKASIQREDDLNADENSGGEGGEGGEGEGGEGNAGPSVS